MAEEYILPMRAEFPRWYRQVDISRPAAARCQMEGRLFVSPRCGPQERRDHARRSAESEVEA